MRGITPVIAIVLLLLMAVAAAGGFYFVYQGFTESGEESGSTQIEQLGETSLAALQIESAAGGRIYVKNVGASAIDLSQVSVYVENVPYNVNASSDTLAERSRAVLKFTQRPSCSSERCEVKISGAASTSRTLDLSKLSCSSDADCYPGENCYGGVCVGEEETTDDEMPGPLLLPVGIGQDSWLARYDWNGTTYDFTENVTDADDPSVATLHQTSFLSNGNHIVSGSSYNGDWSSCFHSKYDGSSWSYPSNLSSQYDVGSGGLVDSWSDVDSAGNAMFVWEGRLGPSFNRRPQWVSLQDGVASDPDNLTDWGVDSGLTFAFAPDNSGFAIYANTSDFGTHNNHKILYSHWDGSAWDDQGVVANYPNVENANALNFGYWPLLSFADNGDAMAVWVLSNKTNYFVFEYATYDGSSWTYQGNFEGWTPVESVSGSEYVPMGVAHDNEGKSICSAMAHDGGSTFWDFYFTYDGTWSSNQTFPEASGKFLPSISKTPDNTLFAIDMDYGAFVMGANNPWRWTVWNGNSWSDPVYVGPWQAA